MRRKLEPDATKAEAYFERALVVARAQQAKSWELRVAMSMARLWRDQGKRDEARDLLLENWRRAIWDFFITCWRHHEPSRTGQQRHRSVDRYE
jgi:predicted ATPase